MTWRQMNILPKLKHFNCSFANIAKFGEFVNISNAEQYFLY